MGRVLLAVAMLICFGLGIWQGMPRTACAVRRATLDRDIGYMEAELGRLRASLKTRLDHLARRCDAEPRCDIGIPCSAYQSWLDRETVRRDALIELRNAACPGWLR